MNSVMTEMSWTKAPVLGRGYHGVPWGTLFAVPLGRLNWGQGGHVVCTQLGSTVLVNIYGQHRPQKQYFFQNLFELLQSHDNQPWVITGDFNEKPTASRLCRALQSQGAHVLFPSDGLGSRWESPGIIDY